MIKIFGVGNVLLCDDGIGVKVIFELKEKLKALSAKIEVIVGETDVYYCLDSISDDDVVIVVDSTYFMKEPGTVITKKFAQCDEFIEEIYTVHDLNLLKSLRFERSEVKGYLVGIEVNNIEYSTELSNVLKEKFNQIKETVLQNIKSILKEEESIGVKYD